MDSTAGASAPPKNALGDGWLAAMERGDGVADWGCWGNC